MAERETWEMNDFFGLAPFPVAMTSLSFFLGYKYFVMLVRISIPQLLLVQSDVILGGF